MIATLLSESDGTPIMKKDRSLFAILAVLNNKSKISYAIYNDKIFSTPRIYDQDNIRLLDDFISNEWVSKEYKDKEIYSFSEWCEDENFYQYLYDDGWKPEKTKWANNLIMEWYRKTIDDSAIKSAGSIEFAKKEIAKNKYESQFRLYKEGGYDTTDLINPEDQEIDNSPIDIEDLKLLNHGLSFDSQYEFEAEKIN